MSPALQDGIEMKEIHIRLFIRVMEALKGKRVWVHCALNYRASAFIYHYRKTAFGLSSEDAMSPMFDKWRPDDTWRALMDLTAEEIGL